MDYGVRTKLFTFPASPLGVDIVVINITDDDRGKHKHGKLIGGSDGVLPALI